MRHEQLPRWYKKEAKDVYKLLQGLGVPAAVLHGDMSQSARAASLAAFRAAVARVLVATDVAARGLDVPSVTHVINLSLGCSLDAYVHRVGRCGRAGRSGVAHTLVLEGDEALAPGLAELLERSRQPVPPPLVEMARHFRRAEGSAAARGDPRAQRQFQSQSRGVAGAGGGGGDGVPSDGGAAAAEDEDDSDEDERRKANRERQLKAQQSKQQKEKAQQTAKGGRKAGGPRR